jgi:hypothetical protein
MLEPKIGEANMPFHHSVALKERSEADAISALGFPLVSQGRTGGELRNFFKQPQRRYEYLFFLEYQDINLL